MGKGRMFTEYEKDFISVNYAAMDTVTIASMLRRSVASVHTLAYRLALSKFTVRGRGSNRIVWSGQMLEFLKKNYRLMSNKKLAAALGLKLTVVRMKLYQLGLQRMQLHTWTAEEIKYLKRNYRKMGDVEIADNMQVLFPKEKKWTKQHISKKRGYLGLNRTAGEYAAIRTKNSSPGGSAYTIHRNSSSITMHDSWVAQKLAWRNRQMADHYKKNHPELIELKRAELTLRRTIKTLSNG